MASEAKAPLKGILKKPTSTSTPATTTNPASPPTTFQASSLPPPPNPRDAHAVALQHAHLLQTRKDTEAAILDNLLTLLDLPQHAHHPASSPHPDDVAAFNHLLRPFQPSDYDDLITERNLADNRCGYALCPRPRRRFKGAGTYKMINKGRRDFDIVETRELEKWCSTECTRRALWVKVQLNETAAWERVGLPELRIELYPEKEPEHEGAVVVAEGSAAGGSTPNSKADKPGSEKLATGMAPDLQPEEDRKAAQDRATLALERGQNARHVSMRPLDLVIREKKVVTEVAAPAFGGEPAEGASIEGYKPRFGGNSRADAAADSEGEDWIAI